MTRCVTFSKTPELIRRKVLDQLHRGEEMGPDPLLQPYCRLGVDGSINLQGMERLTIIIFVNQPDGPVRLPSHRLLEELIQAGLRQVSA